MKEQDYGNTKAYPLAFVISAEDNERVKATCPKQKNQPCDERPMPGCCKTMKKVAFLTHLVQEFRAD